MYVFYFEFLPEKSLVPTSNAGSFVFVRVRSVDPKHLDLFPAHLVRPARAHLGAQTKTAVRYSSRTVGAHWGFPILKTQG